MTATISDTTNRTVIQRPVLWWATIGTAAVVVQLYVYARWVTSGHFRSTPTGSDPVPQWEKVTAWIEQGAFTAAAVGTLGWIVVRCVRRRRLIFDAKLFIGTLALTWLDPIGNMVRIQFFMNSYYLNRGSWTPYIPGWISPNAGNLPNPLLVEFTGYATLPLAAVLGCYVMRFVARRRPGTGPVGLTVAVWVFMMVAVVIIHQVLVQRSGWAMWTTPQRDLTIFAGTRWQLPIIPDVMFWGAMFAALAVLRYFRDPDGPSFVERGTDRLPVRIRTLVSTLAVVGYTTTAMLGYAVSAVAVSLYPGDTMPSNVPSYLVNDMCGPTTEYDCPHPGAPFSVDGHRDHQPAR
ncbi:spirocyclase AveC family protein [Nocardia uniformis]|uniref:Spirocyclase AveC family protein n=1 Tax=Nocardia uniformis TaxID=53432 RepID=A0A849BY28_9NOCA|nr:spirocyclase AveC family protein [Nocardia uniformis]NNH71184.1 spirocyclase AveC family protein [Nocardia uniformis]